MVNSRLIWYHEVVPGSSVALYHGVYWDDILPSNSVLARLI